MLFNWMASFQKDVRLKNTEKGLKQCDKCSDKEILLFISWNCRLPIVLPFNNGSSEMRMEFLMCFTNLIVGLLLILIFRF